MLYYLINKAKNMCFGGAVHRIWGKGGWFAIYIEIETDDEYWVNPF